MLEFAGQIVTGALVPAVGWLLHRLGALQKDITELRVHVAEECVKRDALQPLREDVEWIKRFLLRNLPGKDDAER